MDNGKQPCRPCAGRSSDSDAADDSVHGWLCCGHGVQGQAARWRMGLEGHIRHDDRRHCGPGCASNNDNDDKAMDRLYEFLALVGLGIVLLLCGCSSVRYVPQASTHDTLVKVNTVYKTQRVYDSVWVKEVVKGDTVRIDRWHKSHSTDTLCVTDTLWMVKCDTVRVTVPVERKAPWWERRVKPVVNHLLTVVLLVVLLYCLYYIKERKGKD